MPRQMWLQPLGIGALTVLHDSSPSPSEQSNEPSPGVGDTHDGGGEVCTCTHAPDASENSAPSGQAPASFGCTANATHPQAGVRQIWDGSQSPSPQGKAPASFGGTTGPESTSASSPPPSLPGEASLPGEGSDSVTMLPPQPQPRTQHASPAASAIVVRNVCRSMSGSVEHPLCQRSRRRFGRTCTRRPGQGV